mgnify:CR=1 FL=1
MPAPVLYLSHGAPPLADDARWTRELADWSATIERPKDILMVSAHWEAAPVALSSTTGAPLLYDFWGFPQRYYEVTYDAPGAPELAQSVAGLLSGAGESRHQDPSRGLDHGAYVPLMAMYPEADVPVLQLSLPTLDPEALLALGAALRPLRDEGVLIVGSGFMTHGLPFLREFVLDAPPPEWSRDFDRWAAAALSRHDVAALVRFREVPSARFAHPTVEHFAPLFVALGAAEPGAPMAAPVTGYWLGLSKRSVQFA